MHLQSLAFDLLCAWARLMVCPRSLRPEAAGRRINFSRTDRNRRRPAELRFLYFAGVFSLTISGIALQGCQRVASSKPVGEPVAIAAPLGLPPVPIPADSPATADAIALGKKLFYDPSLSKQGTLSCASCHIPAHHFSDPHNVSLGFGGAHGARNAPTILNAAYLPSQFWDGHASSLEEQILGPVANPVEMDNTARGVVANLEKQSQYPPLFQKAFGTPDVTLGRVENAVASYERTLLSGDSAFDRYQYGGDKTALTAQQIRGLAIFRDSQRGNCAVCHTISAHYALFTDGKFHNIGEGVDDDGKFDDVGRMDQSHLVADTGAFETPTLRDIAETGPYMHNGRLRTLDEVVQYYAGQGNSNPYLDQEMKKIHLTAQDRSDLVAFLHSLTGTNPNRAQPTPEKAVHP